MLDQQLKGITLKSTGIYLLMREYPNITKTEIMEAHKVGSAAMITGYKELIKADLIGFRTTIRGKSRGGYFIKDKKTTPVVKLQPLIKQEADIRPDEKTESTGGNNAEKSELFYKTQIDLSKEKTYFAEYGNFCLHISGQRPRRDKPPIAFLVPDQVSYEAFIMLQSHAKRVNTRMQYLLEEFVDNDELVTGFDRLYVAMNKWLDDTTS